MPPCPTRRPAPTFTWLLLLTLGWLGPASARGDEPPRAPELAEVERWFQSLLDDNLDGGTWSQAAREITRADPPPTWPDQWLVPAHPITLPRPNFPGESLRSRRKPSVADLFALRLADLAAREQRPPAVRMAEHLLAWDRSLALPALQKGSRLIREELAELGGHEDNQRGRLIEKFVRFTLDRVALGDRTAPREYADLIRTTQPAWFNPQPLAVLEPLYRFPDDPDIADTARWMFLNPRSPWLALWETPAPLPEGAAKGRLDLLTSSLLSLPDFRRAVGTWLADLADAGTVEIRPPGQRLAVQTHLGFRGETSRQFFDGEGALASAVTSTSILTSFRRADLVAWRLANLEGAPRFGLDWPVERRDEAIRAVRAYLDRFGPSLMPDDPSRPRLPGEKPGAVVLELPALDHPATRADVAEGQAVFTLDGEPGERRVVPLPERPLVAQWVAYRRPGERTFATPGSNRLGRVWQAEEVWQEGRWVRYFGFVVEHQMVRLPAAALEFGSGFETPLDRRFSRGTPLYLVPEGATIPWASHSQFPPAWLAESPLPIPIRLRNLRGDDLAIPTDLVERRDGRAVALAAGLALELTFNPARADRPTRPFEEGKSIKIDLRREIALPGANPGPTTTLGPGGLGPTTLINLRDLYPIREAGRYVLRMTYTPPGARQPDAASQSMAVLVGWSAH